MDLINKKFKSNNCGDFTVLEKIPHSKGTRYLCEFDEVFGVKHKVITLKKHILSGGLRNPYYPSKLGVACIGDVNSKHYVKEFNKWRAMIERCYDVNNNHYYTYGGKGVSVCDKWLCFEYFLNDLEQLEGYDKEKLMKGELHLDKDIIGTGLLYSPETCILTSVSENVKEMNQRIKQKKFKAIRISDGYEEIIENQTEFAIRLGVNQSNISKCLKGEQKSCKGYKFELL